MTEDIVPPGAPTVDKAGPLLPTLETNIKPRLLTASAITSQILLFEIKWFNQSLDHLQSCVFIYYIVH